MAPRAARGGRLRLPWAATLLATSVILSPASARAQASAEEMQPKRYDEAGRPLEEGEGERCRRRAEAHRTRCLNRALREVDLNSADTSFYRLCAEASRAALRRCLGGGASR